tara:strand:+ start:6929 stop:7360 length:432 start_codon:yes stop_codon:yes gene_type:complete
MQQKRHKFWNVMIVSTIIVCLLAFLAHAKNWTSVKGEKMQILSGFYYKKLNLHELDSVEMVEKIPPMIRLNGFSAFDRGKGIYQEFKDSLTDRKVYVFVDNFSSQKIRLVNKDSEQLFLNLKDSLDTQQLYDLLKSKVAPPTK